MDLGDSAGEWLLNAPSKFLLGRISENSHDTHVAVQDPASGTFCSDGSLCLALKCSPLFWILGRSHKRIGLLVQGNSAAIDVSQMWPMPRGFQEA